MAVLIVDHRSSHDTHRHLTSIDALQGGLNMKFEAFPENTEAGRVFKNGWDTYVKTQHLPDVFWDPVDNRWETYLRAQFAFTRASLPQISLGSDYWAERTILHEVINIGGTIRVLNTKVVWDPRDGYWYYWNRIVVAPPKPPGIPAWMQQLNTDLEAVARNTNLTPEERYQARIALIKKAYGTQ